MNYDQQLLHEGAPWVILVHYGDPALTAKCLDSLAKTEDCPHGAVVVDHGPELLPIDYWQRFHPNVVAVQDASNPGFGAGCNRGAEEALSKEAGSLWFLNNDATLERPMLGALLGYASKWPEIALWGTHQKGGAKIIGPTDNKKWFAAASEREGKNPSCQQRLGEGAELLGPGQSLGGASIFITRPNWGKLGPWPDEYFLYWEDAAWCLRAHRLGLPMAIVSLSVVHAGSATTVRQSPLSIFYGARNQLLLHAEAAQGHGAWLARLFMKLHLLQKCIFRGRFALLRPTWDGIAAAARDERGRDRNY